MRSHSGGNVHCWCLTEEALQKSKDAGDEMSWGNCDNTDLTAEHGSTSQSHCTAPNNGNNYFLTETHAGMSYRFALGGACRSAVYKMD